MKEDTSNKSGSYFVIYYSPYSHLTKPYLSRYEKVRLLV